MSIPLDRLYNFLHDISDHDIIIYRFFPHGSKNLSDICFDQIDFDEYSIIPETDIANYAKLMTTPLMICHDQEPLYYYYYNHQRLLDHAKSRVSNRHDMFSGSKFSTKTKLEFINKLPSMHLRSALDAPFNVYDKVLLTHSEKNSQELELYKQNNFVGVYWWSHALIALDWYRYAEHDAKLKFNPANIQQDFLVYNRAWSGTREYRLKFAEYVVQKNLADKCHMRFNEQDGNFHYKSHTYQNSKFAITTDLCKHFETNTFSSNSSGDYNSKEYSSCGIDVVLETIFDDQRWHLTEKSLRPIACGKPFIIASTPGVLKYLRSYGFKTFAPFIDESYDDIEDSVQRLNAITDTMKKVTGIVDKTNLWTKLHEIAEYNKQHFFSSEFRNQVIAEYKENLNAGMQQLQAFKSGKNYYWYKNLHEQDGADRFDSKYWDFVESKL